VFGDGNHSVMMDNEYTGSKFPFRFLQANIVDGSGGPSMVVKLCQLNETFLVERKIANEF
jgi:hypothetical protein